MRKRLIHLGLLALLAAIAARAQTPVRILDTLMDGQGRRINATLQISWGSFVSGPSTIQAGSTFTSVTNGNLDVSLIPNLTSGVPYIVRFPSPVCQETWLVPVSSVSLGVVTIRQTGSTSCVNAATGGGSGAVASVFGRTGAVVAVSTDYAAHYAALVSGVVAPAQLGTTPGAGKFLDGLGVFRVVDAGDITTGTFADARIPSLNVSKLTAGTFVLADGRLPTSGGGTILPTTNGLTVSKAVYTDASGRLAAVTGVGTYVKADGTTGDPGGGAVDLCKISISGVTITFGAGISTSSPCIYKSSEQGLFTLVAAQTWTIGGTGTAQPAKVYVSIQGIPTVLRDTASTTTVTGNGGAAVVSASGSPVFASTVWPLATLSMNPAGTTTMADERPLGGSWGIYTAGDGLQQAVAGTLSVDSSVTRNGAVNIMTGQIDNSAGSAAIRLPNLAADPGTCAVGSKYWNTTSSKFRNCTATNTWADESAAGGAALKTYLFTAAEVLGSGGASGTNLNVAGGFGMVLVQMPDALSGGNMPEVKVTIPPHTSSSIKVKITPIQESAAIGQTMIFVVDFACWTSGTISGVTYAGPQTITATATTTTFRGPMETLEATLTTTSCAGQTGIRVRRDPADTIGDLGYLGYFEVIPQ